MASKKTDPKAKHHRYSGPKSTAFWKRVDGLKHVEDRRSLYSCGVLLQNMEENVLHWLDAAEKRSTDG